MTIAWVAAAHGVRGALRLRPETDFPERLPGRRVWLEGPAPRWAVLETVQPYRRGMLIARVDGVVDREGAEALRGYELQVPMEELPPLPAGEYYHHQIVGLAVVDEQGADLGRVTEVRRTGANDVYVVERSGGRRWMLPAVRAFVLEIDLEAARITVRPIPGLIE